MKTNIEFVQDRRSEIRNKLETTPISMGQFDLNGKCNAKCWYCPVKYEGNPQDFAVQMSIDDLNHIFKNLRSSPIFPQEMRFMYSCNYNEVLLYTHFSELVVALKRYNFTTMILSNGTPLTPDKIDIILDNPDIFWGIALNIPAFEREEWSIKSGMNRSIHKILLSNLDYLHSKGNAIIQVNCTTSNYELLDKGILTSDEHIKIISDGFKSRYPNFEIHVNTALSDRAGKLDKLKVLSKKAKATNQVIDCSHSGSRVYKWLHINAKGDLFICCDDFNMQYCFGNLLKSSLEDIWFSEDHIDAIIRQQAELCVSCVYRIEHQSYE